MNPEITIVAVTFNHGRILRAFCDNMLNQHGVEGRWKCIIAHDGPIDDPDPKVAESAWHAYETTRAAGEQFKFVYSERRENVSGHNLREIGLNKVTTPWVHITNADNQYSYGWLERLLPFTSDSFDLVTWPISHSYTEFHQFVPELRGGKIDFCNYAMRTSCARELGFPWRHFEADGAQIEAFVQKFGESRVGRMTNLLAFHN